MLCLHTSRAQTPTPISSVDRSTSMSCNAQLCERGCGVLVRWWCAGLGVGTDGTWSLKGRGKEVLRGSSWVGTTPVKSSAFIFLLRWKALLSIRKIRMVTWAMFFTVRTNFAGPTDERTVGFCLPHLRTFDICNSSRRLSLRECTGTPVASVRAVPHRSLRESWLITPGNRVGTDGSDPR